MTRTPLHLPPRRDTIKIKRKPDPRDKHWHGAAPRPLPEREKDWRPKDFVL